MNIREAKTADAERLRELGVRGWETTYGSFVRADNRLWYLNQPFWSVDTLRSIITTPACRTLVTELDGAIIGFLTAEPCEGGEIELTRLYVDPDHRGAGAGRALIDQLCRHLRAEGHRTLLVNAFGDNRGGRRFYEREGFELVAYNWISLRDQILSDVWYRLTL